MLLRVLLLCHRCARPSQRTSAPAPSFRLDCVPNVCFAEPISVPPRALCSYSLASFVWDPKTSSLLGIGGKTRVSVLPCKRQLLWQPRLLRTCSSRASLVAGLSLAASLRGGAVCVCCRGARKLGLRPAGSAPAISHDASCVVFLDFAGCRRAASVQFVHAVDQHVEDHQRSMCVGPRCLLFVPPRFSALATVSCSPFAVVACFRILLHSAPLFA